MSFLQIILAIMMVALIIKIKKGVVNFLQLLFSTIIYYLNLINSTLLLIEIDVLIF
ncbi:hypothetical protein SDC9_132834 [bioreactor metagenome]|uniref:Uncharacterized protein n=1 Tax=bioreactor metagenome TaxID=1076179 RepID=A0A645DA09_9ZZZZ